MTRSLLLLTAACAIAPPHAHAASAQWAPVGAPLGFGASGFALEQFDDGSGPAVFMTGVNLQVGPQPGNGVIKWNGAQWSMIGRADVNDVGALRAFDDGSGPALYTGGAAVGFGGIPGERGVFRLRNGVWETVRGDSFFRYIPSIAVASLDVFFTTQGPRLFCVSTPQAGPSSDDYSAAAVQQWDGQRWAPLGPGAGFSSFARPAVVTDFFGEQGLLAVSASYAGGVPCTGVAMWNGRRWRTVGGGGPALTSITATSGAGAQVCAAGFRLNQKSQVYSMVDDAWQQLGPDFTNSAHDLRVRFIDDGSGPALFAFGDFTAIGGVPITGIARWDGAAWRAAGARLASSVVDLLAFTDAKGRRWLYACGKMTIEPGASATYPVARIRMDCILGLPGDANADGSVDFLDINLILSAFGAAQGQPAFLQNADLNHDGHVDFLDLNIVLSAFGQAC